MIPLLVCPFCKKSLMSKNIYYKQEINNCISCLFTQYVDSESKNIISLSFTLEKFNVSMIFCHALDDYNKTVKIYLHSDKHKVYVTPIFEPDFSDLLVLKNKIKTYINFS